MGFESAVRYPMNDENWVTTVLIGGAFLLFSFLLVPMILVYGYIVRAISSSTAGDAEPPAFGDWESLLVDGIQAWLVFVVYMLVPLIVGVLTLGASVGAILTGGDAGVSAGIWGLFTAFVLTTLLSLLFGYVAVVAVVNFAREGRLGAAFDAGTIKTVAFDREYAVAWLVSVLVFVAVGIVGAVPLVGWLLAPFATFYAAVVAANLWAEGFDAAVEGRGGYARPRDRESTV